MGQSAFKDIDNVPLGLQHLKIWFTSGMGFFTDAYDLFIIGIVLILLEGNYGTSIHISAGNALVGAGLIGSSAIIAAIIGQLMWGILADKFGRKSIYGIEATILAIGAILSAFAWNYWSLFAFRFILGIGIGGDYPVSATIMSEYANVKDRGKLIALVFANQGIGSLTAVAVGLGSVAALPPELAWRLMLGFGAIPALAVIYLRRKLPETPRYSAYVLKDKVKAEIAAKFVKSDANISSINDTRVNNFRAFISNYWKMLIVTAGSWFLLDIAFYGTGIFSGPITSQIIPPHSLEQKIVLAGVPFMVGFLGYFSAVAFIDKIGRKTLQILGFFGMAILYFVVSSEMIAKGTKITGFMLPVNLMFLLYALTFFFIDFGPNTTTFIIPAEIYPVKFRTTGHGISAAAGKAGAALTTFYFSYLLLQYGLKEVLIGLAIVSLIGGLLSFGLKETKNISLEEITEENQKSPSEGAPS